MDQDSIERSGRTNPEELASGVRFVAKESAHCF